MATTTTHLVPVSKGESFLTRSSYQTRPLIHSGRPKPWQANIQGIAFSFWFSFPMIETKNPQWVTPPQVHETISSAGTNRGLAAADSSWPDDDPPPIGSMASYQQKQSGQTDGRTCSTVRFRPHDHLGRGIPV
jgi:hypothetical protein